jgi:hypothetical protein
LQTAESDLAECRAAVERLALESDKTALDRALQARRAAEDLVGALSDASVKINNEIANVEAEIERVVDGRMRSETAAAISAMIERFEKAGAVYDAACLEYISAAKELGLLVAEARGVAAFLELECVQLPPENAVVVREAKNHRAAVLSGGARPSLPQPAPEPPKLAVVPAAPMMTVLAMKNLKYIGVQGTVICCGKYRRHDLPQKLAELALRERLALPLSDPRIRDLEHGAVAYVPTEGACEWLGPAGREAARVFMRPGGPVMHSSLTEFRGEHYRIIVPRGPEPVPMARKPIG